MKEFVKRLFKPGLRNKLLFTIAGLITALFTVVLLYISVNVDERIRSGISADFQKTRKTFETFQQYRFSRLLEICILISEQPQFKANVDLAKNGLNAEVHNTVLFNANEFKKLVDFDIIFITDRYGNCIIRSDKPDKYGESLLHLPFVKDAMEGYDAESVSPLILDDGVYQVVSAPILLRDDILGALVIGLKIKNNDAEQLKSDASSEVTFFNAHKIITTTLDEESGVDLTKATFVYNDTLMNAFTKGLPTNPIEILLKDEKYLVSFASVSPADTSGGIYYAVATSLRVSLSTLTTIQRIIVFAGIFAVLFTAVVSFLIARSVTNPIKKLVEGAHRIGTGDFNFRITLNSKDEIGTLASAFNEMTSGLLERYHMQKFVSTSTLSMIRQADKGEIKLGGERKNVTVLFSDIRGFTAFSEKVDPEEVIGMLNMYLSKQAKLVLKFNGEIDKYVGDELVAVFEGENMVDNAVLCSLEIQKEMDILHQQLEAKVRIGIGINTGMVVMGNMGSEERMDYTVLGSTVNLGARLCSKAQPGQILISETSFKLLKIKVKSKALEPIEVKGVTRPVMIYEVFS